MSRASPNAALRTLMAEARWSGADLARAVNAAGTRESLRLHYDRTSVGHWLNGAHPRSPVPDLVAAVLSQRIGRNITPCDAGLDPVPPTHRPTRALADLARADQQYRGELYRPTLFAGTPSRGKKSKVAAIEDMIRLFSTLHCSYGGGHARTALAAYIADDAPADWSLGFLLATMTADTRYQGLALRYYMAVIRLADHFDHYAVTLRALSTQAEHLQHPIAAAYAEMALSLPAGRPVQAYLYAGRAAAGAGESALRDLDRAESALDDEASCECEPFGRYPRASFEYEKGRILQRSGDLKGARRAFETSLRLRPPAHGRDRLLTRAHLAELHLRLGDLDAACAHWNHLARDRDTRSLYVGKARDRMAGLLRPYARNRQAADLLLCLRGHLI
ncbi:hypothetical protein [Embleya sp. NPDC059237]|uniref:hypothetical protein n=1 Tax=Embleya sp. NPDC059237 TaxID=3346784 RepID=UPI003695E8A9